MRIWLLLLSRLSIGYKLMLSFFILAFLPVAAIGYFSYDISLESLQNQTQENVESTVQLLNNNVVYKLTDIQRVSDLIYNDPKFQQFLIKPYDTFDCYILLTKDIKNYFVLANKLPNMDHWITVYVNNVSIFENYSTVDKDRVLAHYGYDIYHMNRIALTDWYRNLKDPSGTQSVWMQVDDDEQYHNISLIRNLVDFQTSFSLKTIGLLRVSIKNEDLFASSDDIKFGEGSLFMVLDNEGIIRYSNEKMTTITLAQKLDSVEYLKIRQKIPDLNWDLVVLVPYSQLQESAVRVRNVTIMVCLFSLLVLIVISGLISKYFALRIKKIVNSLNMFREGEFYKRVNVSNSDELSQISVAFNDMAGTIDNLIQEVYVSKILKTEAELKALQAQINPHFLYNTLSSISTLAHLGQTDKLHEMVLGLSTFYRLTLNNGSFITPIEKEIQHAITYVDIQVIKYGERVQVHYDLDPQLMQYDTIKIILQPFIENAIEHGLFMDNVLHINIVCKLEGELISFKVIDDGVGMDETLTDQLMDHAIAPPGYGIRNVDERIKHQFGRSYGVSLFSRQGIGTTVSIVFPVFKSGHTD